MRYNLGLDVASGYGAQPTILYGGLLAELDMLDLDVADLLLFFFF